MAAAIITDKGQRIQDRTGNRFGRLVILAYSHSGNGGPFWRCWCDCETETVVSWRALRSGNTRSCGCLHRERAVKMGKSNRTHGADGTPEYQAWRAMKRRCYEKSRDGFERYGGRGITVCDRWRNDFAAFLADVGLRPSPKHSIDRFPDNNSNYEPGNVRWATAKEQGRNKANNRLLTYKEEVMPLSAWAERVGLSRRVLRARLKNWTVERALETPFPVKPKRGQAIRDF